MALIKIKDKIFQTKNPLYFSEKVYLNLGK